MAHSTSVLSSIVKVIVLCSVSVLHPPEQEEQSLVQEQELESFDPQAALRSNSILKASRNRFAEIIKRYELQKTQPELPMELHVIQIGDIAFASNRFELYMDYQHRIQAI